MQTTTEEDELEGEACEVRLIYHNKDYCKSAV